MNQLTQVLYLLSNALLIPVMLLLIISVIRVLIQAGSVIHEFLHRSQAAKARRELEAALTQSPFMWTTASAPAGDTFSQTLSSLSSASGDLPRIAYLLSQAELQWAKAIDRLKGLVKLGPGLGLMGTLIPLGPALVGLALGDIQTMSSNLVIAFSTTVLGLFVGMLAGFLVSVKKHWYQADAALLNFVAERVCSSSPASNFESARSSQSSDADSRQAREVHHA
jgi:biopolymer transport protein ExbB/TolQ